MFRVIDICNNINKNIILEDIIIFLIILVKKKLRKVIKMKFLINIV